MFCRTTLRGSREYPVDRAGSRAALITSQADTSGGVVVITALLGTNAEDHVAVPAIYISDYGDNGEVGRRTWCSEVEGSGGEDSGGGIMESLNAQPFDCLLLSRFLSLFRSPSLSLTNPLYVNFSSKRKELLGDK